MDDKEPTVRAAAAECYGMLDPEPKVAVPALLKLLADDADLRVKAGAAKGLGAIGSGAAAALPELRKVQQEYNKKMREAKPTTPAEREALKLDRDLYNAARGAVTSIGPKKK